MYISDVKFSRTWFQSTVEKGEWEQIWKMCPNLTFPNWKDTLRKAEIKRSTKKVWEHTHISKHTNILKRGMHNGLVLHKKHDIYFVKAEVMASMASRIYTSYICMSKEGDVHEDLVTVLQGKCMIYSFLVSIVFRSVFVSGSSSFLHQ